MFQRLSRGPSFGAGLALGLIAVFLAQTAWARVSTTEAKTIRACLSRDGELNIVTSERRWNRCPVARRLEWRVQGDPGPAGATGAQGPQGERGPAGAPGANSLVSPNGRFRIDISDRGIFLRGPGGTIYVDRFGAAATAGQQIVGS